jgi:DNA polymerase III delta subunit
MLLVGDDSITREHTKNHLVNTIEKLNGEKPEWESYDRGNESIEAFTERFITPSLFQSTRIFHTRHADTFTDHEIAALIDVCGYDVDDAYLLVEADQDTKRGKKRGAQSSLEALKKHFVSSSKKHPEKFYIGIYEKPPDYKIAEWIVKTVPTLFNRMITKSNAERLVELVGYEFEMLFSELQKIDIYLDAGAGIERDTIEAVSGATREKTPFELARAVGKRDMRKALEIIEYLFTTTFYAPTCINTMYRHFWNVYKIKCCIDSDSQPAKRYARARDWGRLDPAFEIGCGAGLLKSTDSKKRAYPVIVIPGLIEQAMSYSHQELRKIFALLEEFDVGVKTGQVEVTKTAIQMLCYRITRMKQVIAAGV